ncbi:MAG TPA: hypothetical protein VFA39_10990, partial [Steroidobacteraceae bacterium]|nr:hypothetical protein [Steroidobacteraceae bacterium]
MNTTEAPVHECAARSSESADLVRGLGPWQTTAVVVSTIIGTGVFLVAAPMARAAGSPGLVFVAWLAGWLASTTSFGRDIYFFRVVYPLRWSTFSEPGAVRRRLSAFPSSISIIV